MTLGHRLLVSFAGGNTKRLYPTYIAIHRHRKKRKPGSVPCTFKGVGGRGEGKKSMKMERNTPPSGFKSDN